MYIIYIGGKSLYDLHVFLIGFFEALAESWLAWSKLRRFHGQVHGAFGADEHLAGRMPSRGTELCVVVEAMWSMAVVAQLAPSDAEALEALDALEDMAFNALQGSLSEGFLVPIQDIRQDEMLYNK